VRYQVEPEALRALMRYDWPGNVRELVNVLERAQILAEGHVITSDDLPEDLTARSSTGWTEQEEGGTQNLRALQRRHVLVVLREARGNKVQAARALGISRRALYRLLEKYQVHRPGEPEAPLTSSPP